MDDHDALLCARCADRVPMSDRLRALISLWRLDPALAKAVSTRAQELAANPVPTPAASPEPPTHALDPQAPLAS